MSNDRPMEQNSYFDGQNSMWDDEEQKEEPVLMPSSMGVTEQRCAKREIDLEHSDSTYENPYKKIKKENESYNLFKHKDENQKRNEKRANKTRYFDKIN